MHPIRIDRRRMLASSFSLAATIPFFRSVRAADAATKKVLYFTKSQTFQHTVVARTGDGPAYSERLLKEFMAPVGIEIESTKDGTVFDGDLSEYDAFFFYTTGDLTQPGTDKSPPMSPKGKQNLLEAIASGKGMFGSHCASDTFHSKGEAFQNQSERDPYIEMLGGEFIRHGKQQEAKMRVVDSAFPGIGPAGQEFTLHEEWYSLKNFNDDIHVILVQETQGMEGFDYERPPYPATWAREHGKGRVFYTSMGHREDVWAHAVFQSLVIGGLSWVTHKINADIPANLSSVAPHANDLPHK